MRKISIGKKIKRRSTKMIAEELINTARNEFERVLQYVVKTDNTQISDMEKGIFRHLLKIGFILLLVYVQKFAVKVTNCHIDKNGVKREFHSVRNRDYLSVFGKIEIIRPYYWRKGSEGICPADAELNLPEGVYSYLLQEWGTCLSTEQPYEKAAAFLNTFLNMQIWNSSLEEIARKSSKSVNEFYNTRLVSLDNKNDILVATVDCKGIQMRKSELQAKEVQPKFKRMRRPGERAVKGEESSKNIEKRDGKKKMSVITAVYTINRHMRTVDDIMSKHKGKSDKKSPLPPRPQEKIVYGTLNGKQAAFEYLKLEISKRDRENKKRIALVDGELKLNEMLKEYLPGFEIIRDFFHVTEYLWDGSHIFYEKGSKKADELVSRYVQMLLNGNVSNIILEMRSQFKKTKKSKAKIKELGRITKYLENGKDYMKYDEYLASGYPIGSGVIEGTCKNLVNDRFEHTGMHWSIEGANALLGLRSIHVNNLTSSYWQFHQKKERERLYGHLSDGIDMRLVA